ncbi:MAG: PBP1A family penicillin-binding protein [Clostridia bacterium]|nr:PBP1A family penicillin-binding protein [Clostridia bacterium]
MNKIKKPIKSKKVKDSSVPSFWQIFSSTFGTAVKIIFSVVLLAGAIVGGLGIGLVSGWIESAYVIQEADLEINTNLTTYIYADDGKTVIEKLTGSDNINREQVGFESIPKNLQNAIVAIEDERFYEHQGFDIIRIGGSIVALVTNKGEISQGGSTLTQQVYKNITGRFEQTFERKFQEIYNAIRLEMKIDKNQILTLYANIINMGNGSYGFKSASAMYFGKDISTLNLAECALLAGIPNAPSQYNPYTEKGLKDSISRQHLVLNKMLELGMISQAEYDEAYNYELVIVPKEELLIADRATSYFVDQVISDVIKQIALEKNVSERTASQWVYNNGYKIYTTIDLNIQASMDEVFLDPSYFLVLDDDGNVINKDAEKYAETPQAAMVIMDQTNGEVKAIYGGSGEKTGSRTYNRATQAERQPGSSFKPIAIYGPSIDLKLITAATIIDDVPVRLDPKNPEDIYPTNYTTGSYKGLTTIRNALKASVNVVAARVFVEYLGRDNCVDYLNRVGIDRGDYIYDDSTVSVATGGLEKGVNPLLMASAFTTFANNGIYIPDHTYREVLDAKENVVIKFNQPFVEAYSEQSAFIMTSMLQEATLPANTSYGVNGTASGYVRIQDGEMPVAGKTGTTSDYWDKWFVGYTPYYTAAVWYGYDNNIAPISLKKLEYNQALIIWDAVMEKVHEGLLPKNFSKPTTGIVTRDICIYSGKVATDLCYQDPRATKLPDVITEYFIEGTEPAFFEECDVHQIIPQCTASTDLEGRYLLATPDCPQSTIINKVGLVRPKPYIPQDPDDPVVADRYLEIPVGEYCTEHGKQEILENIVNNGSD